MTPADTLFGGLVSLAQPPRGRGYRANVDALILADFAGGPRPARVAFDLGAGSGAVALSLLHRGACERAVLIEIEPEAARLARVNVESNGWAARATVLEGDVVTAARAHRGEAELVVCNPPYVAPGRGRVAREPARARARSGDLGVFLSAARALLGRRGRACFVYPARELVTMVGALRGAGLEPKTLRAVRPTATAPARVVLVETIAGKPGGLTVVADLVERDAGGYTPELARLVG